MRLIVAFISGVVVCGLLVLGAKAVLPTRADTDNTTPSDNVTQSLVDLIPDIEKIYRESLTRPFIKAKSKIYDEDIAEFYQELLDNSVLYEPGNETN